jgi:hypothetical protein
VRETEAKTTAELEAARRANSSLRRMQTVMNMKAPELPQPAPKATSSLLQLLLGVLAGVAVVGVVVLLTANDPPEPPLDAAEGKVDPAAAQAIPVEPEVTPVEPNVTPVEVVEPSPEPVVLPVEAMSGDSVPTPEAQAESTPERPALKASQPAPKAKQKPVKASKPVSPSSPSRAPTPAPAPAPKSTPKSDVIVRDTPF